MKPFLKKEPFSYASAIMIAAMLIAAYAAFVWSTSAGVKPDTNSERWLCDHWAGAQCHGTSCQKDGKERCTAVGKAFTDTGKQSVVPRERAEKQAACARALLKAPKPAECDGVM